MENIFYFKDDQYTYKGYDHTRTVVRAILLDEHNNVCVQHILDDDMFGHRDYYETPGGGVNADEPLEDALKREIIEEVGYKSKVIKKIGVVEDFYNLINRKNINHYYLIKREDYVGKHLEKDEIIRIHDTLWLPIEKVIEMYQNMQNELVGKLVKQRELPILLLAKELIKNIK